MKIKTTELKGKALNWAVRYALNERRPLDYVESRDNFSTCWNKGGPLIEREGILLRPIRSPGHSLDGQCLAMYGGTNTGTMVQWVKREDWHRHYLAGPTMLIAAMRCFVTSKLGREVEIPEELL